MFARSYFAPGYFAPDYFPEHVARSSNVAPGAAIDGQFPANYAY